MCTRHARRFAYLLFIENLSTNYLTPTIPAFAGIHLLFDLRYSPNKKSPAPQEQDFTFRPNYNYVKYYTASPHRRSPPYRTIGRTSTTARH